jgi:hypothetical protein
VARTVTPAEAARSIGIELTPDEALKYAPRSRSSRGSLASSIVGWSRSSWTEDGAARADDPRQTPRISAPAPRRRTAGVRPHSSRASGDSVGTARCRGASPSPRCSGGSARPRPLSPWPERRKGPGRGLLNKGTGAHGWAPGFVVLEKPSQQQDDDDERNETATDIHSGLLCSIDASTTVQAGEGLRRGRYDGAAAPWPSG